MENLKELSKEELKKKLVLLMEDVRIINFKAEGSKSKNVKEKRALKKQIARISTELNSDAKCGVRTRRRRDK